MGLIYDGSFDEMILILFCFVQNFAAQFQKQDARPD